MRRWFLVLAALLLLGLALATAAYAKEIEGTGTPWAKGAGVAVVRGDGGFWEVKRRARSGGVGSSRATYAYFADASHLNPRVPALS